MTFRHPAALVLLAGAVTLLSGCGIRPTEVPVDAGAPASRTACPTAPAVPAAPASPSPSPSPSASPTGIFVAPSASRCP